MCFNFIWLSKPFKSLISCILKLNHLWYVKSWTGCNWLGQKQTERGFSAPCLLRPPMCDATLYFRLYPQSADAPVVTRPVLLWSSSPKPPVIAASLHSALTLMLPVMGCCIATACLLITPASELKPLIMWAEPPTRVSVSQQPRGLFCWLGDEEDEGEDGCTLQKHNWFHSAAKQTEVRFMVVHRWLTCQPGCTFRGCSTGSDTHTFSFGFSGSKVLLVLQSFRSSLSCLASFKLFFSSYFSMCCIRHQTFLKIMVLNINTNCNNWQLRYERKQNTNKLFQGFSKEKFGLFCF